MWLYKRVTFFIRAKFSILQLLLTHGNDNDFLNVDNINNITDSSSNTIIIGSYSEVENGDNIFLSRYYSNTNVTIMK